MDKIIFLDIEGVIFTGCYSGEPEMTPGGCTGRFDPLAIYWLNRLTMETGASIVITSTWRYIYSLESLRRQFLNSGFRGKILGYTPINIDVPRSRNIQDWLDSHEVDQFVIIDDVADDLAYVFPGHYIGTSYHRGLTVETYHRGKERFAQESAPVF